MKNLFFLLLILCYQQLMDAHCPRTWEVGTGIGGCLFAPIPSTGSLTAAAGAVIQLSIRFDDSDNVRTESSRTCTATPNERIESDNASYEITYTIDDVNAASFESATSYVTTKTVAATISATNYDFECRDRSRKIGTLWASIPAKLFIKAGFTAGTIRVKVVIKDNTRLPSGDRGNLQDSPVSHTWIINCDNRPCPVKLVLQPSPQVQNNRWVNAISLGGTVPYVYKCSDGLPTGSTLDYENKLITEAFGAISAAPFFTIDDVNRTLLPDGVTDADQLAVHLFSPFVGQPATFIVNAANSFEDVHSPLLPDGLMNSYPFLGIDNIQAEKCGFSVEQTYECNGSVIMRPTLYKRAFFRTNSSGSVIAILEIKKSH